MALFIAGVGVLLMVAAALAHKLNHPTDHLGLHAARKAVRWDQTKTRRTATWTR